MPFVLPVADPPRASELAGRLGLRPLTAQLLLNRGIAGEAEARRFLEPRLSHLRAPEEDGAEMAGFTRAAERLARAVVGGESIGLFGDYDVDGVTTCALLARFLRDAGARVLPRVARREAGYGFNAESADAFADDGCTLIVTGDCGTSDHQALARARTRGLDVIVVDHHTVPEREPEVLALLNPRQPGCLFPFKGLASVGVAFYLAAALRTRLRALRRDAPDPRELLDLVAIGTIADMVPLTDENRVLVAAGLREAQRARRVGLRALIEVAGLPPPQPGSNDARPLSAKDVSFKLAPLLNAPGRLGEARLALELLLEEDAARAAEAAVAIAALNKRRREIQELVTAEAIAQVDEAAVRDGGRPAVTLAAGTGWHPGVVGIVAARLVERYRRPAIVIGFDGDEGRGSGRVPAGLDFNLCEVLGACASHLVRFGGHAAAAGLTVRRDRLADFGRALEQAARAHRPTSEPGAAPVTADAVVALEEIDERLVDELARLGPFGMGNPEPLLLARDVAVARTRVVGERHLQITLRQGVHERDGIAFNQADQDPGRGARVQAAFVPEVDTFRGARRVRLRLRDLLRAG